VVGKKTQRGSSSSSLGAGQKKQKQEGEQQQSVTVVASDDPTPRCTEASGGDGSGQTSSVTLAPPIGASTTEKALQPITDSLRHWRKRLSKDLRPFLESLVDTVEKAMRKDDPTTTTHQSGSSESGKERPQPDAEDDSQVTHTAKCGSTSNPIGAESRTKDQILLLAGIGIGSFVQSPTAVKQLAFLLSLLDAISARLLVKGGGAGEEAEGCRPPTLRVRTVISDPVMSQEDVAICKLFGLEVDGQNRRGDLSTWLSAKEGQIREDIDFCLCYMPRCPWALYNNVLASLWNTNSPALQRRAASGAIQTEGAAPSTCESDPNSFFDEGGRFLLLGNDLRRFEVAAHQSGPKNRSTSAITALRPFLKFQSARTFDTSAQGTVGDETGDDKKKKKKADRRQGGDAETLFTEIGELTVMRSTKNFLGLGDGVKPPIHFELWGSEGDLR
jgi:hypothetical protein